MSFGTFFLPDQEGSRKGCSQIGIIGGVDFRSVALPRDEFHPQTCLDRGNSKAPIDKKLRTAYEEAVQTGG